MGIHCRRLQEPCRSDGKVLMTNLFRNVEGSPLDPVDTWPYEGMVSVIEYSTLRDWRPIVRHLQEIRGGGLREHRAVSSARLGSQ
jgi:hypothetical protein